MQQLLGTRNSMRPLLGQHGASRAVHARAGAGSDYGTWPLLRACALLSCLTCLGMIALHLTRRTLLGVGLATTLVSVPMAPSLAESPVTQSASAVDMKHRQGEVRYSEEEWRRRLTPEQYRVMRQEATERRGTSLLNKEMRPGVFKCSGCGTPLFNASAKFDSGTGWPSFFRPLPDSVLEVADYSVVFMPRTEVRCRRCQGHLGHVFNDGPAPTGLRYCMNGVALQFEPLMNSGAARDVEEATGTARQA